MRLHRKTRQMQAYELMDQKIKESLAGQGFQEATASDASDAEGFPILPKGQNGMLLLMDERACKCSIPRWINSQAN